MRVVMTISSINLHIISAHAPYEDAHIDRRTAFWDALAAELGTIREHPSNLTLLLVDANAHVGSIPSPSIGKCVVQAENENGASLRATTEETSVVLVNTFFDAGPTWTGSTGKQSRIDYVGVSTKLKACIARCFIAEDIYLATGERDDHNVWAAHRQAPAVTYAAKYTTASVNVPARAAYFQRLMADFIPRHVAKESTSCRAAGDATTSAFAEHAKWAASQSFLPRGRMPR